MAAATASQAASKASGGPCPGGKPVRCPVAGQRVVPDPIEVVSASHVEHAAVQLAQSGHHAIVDRRRGGEAESAVEEALRGRIRLRVGIVAVRVRRRPMQQPEQRSQREIFWVQKRVGLELDARLGYARNDAAVIDPLAVGNRGIQQIDPLGAQLQRRTLIAPDLAQPLPDRVAAVEAHPAQQSLGNAIQWSLLAADPVVEPRDHGDRFGRGKHRCVLQRTMCGQPAGRGAVLTRQRRTRGRARPGR